MKAIKVNKAPKSMIMTLVENNKTFAYNWGDILVMGTENIDKFKYYMVKNGMSQEEVNMLSLELIELETASDLYDF